MSFWFFQYFRCYSSRYMEFYTTFESKSQAFSNAKKNEPGSTWWAHVFSMQATHHTCEVTLGSTIINWTILNKILQFPKFQSDQKWSKFQSGHKWCKTPYIYYLVPRKWHQYVLGTKRYQMICMICTNLGLFEHVCKCSWMLAHSMTLCILSTISPRLREYLKCKLFIYTRSALDQ